MLSKLTAFFLTVICRETVVVHSLDAYIGKLDYDVSSFPWRALMGGGIVILPKPKRGGDKLIKQLKKRGIGPRQVLFVEGDRLIDGIRQSWFLRTLLRWSARVEFFSMSETDGKLCDELGIYHKVNSTHHSIAGELNCKVYLRELLGHHPSLRKLWGGSRLFIPYKRVPNGIQYVHKAMEELLDSPLYANEGFIIKVGYKASGHGQFWARGITKKEGHEKLLEFLHEERAAQELIVEIALPKAVPLSVSYYVDKSRGVEFVNFTHQLAYLDQKAYKPIWDGNELAINGAELPRLSPAFRKLVRSRTDMLAKWMSNHFQGKLAGPLVMDLLFDPRPCDGKRQRLYLLEINPRITFGIYAHRVLQQVAGKSKMFVHAINVEFGDAQKAPHNFDEVVCRIGGLMHGQTHVEIHLVEALPHMCVIAAVSPTIQGAQAAAAEAKLALNKKPVTVDAQAKTAQ